MSSYDDRVGELYDQIDNLTAAKTDLLAALERLMQHSVDTMRRIHGQPTHQQTLNCDFCFADYAIAKAKGD